MKKELLIAFLLLSALVYGTESKYVLTYKRLSTRDIGIICNNGGDPTGNKVGDVLIISCGK